MSSGLIGRKVGMTRFYQESGKSIPVTVIQAGPCFVSQVKTAESDGYSAVQLAFEDVKARNSTVPKIGHDAKAGVSPKRFHREFRLADDEVSEIQPGQQLTVDVFEQIKYVDVTGTTKGHGFTGTMKRYGFKGMTASHGVERKHRSPGSICGRSSNRGTGKPKKGIRMSGQSGNVTSTARSLEVVAQDKDKNLLLVKGAVPGPNKGLVVIRKAIRLSKSKAKQAKAS